MVEVDCSVKNIENEFSKELLKGKRRLTDLEIEILKKNGNRNQDNTWSNIYVDEKEGNFNPELIQLSFFSGYIILGRLVTCRLKYNDLSLQSGIYRSRVSNIVTGNDCVIENVSYMDNYRIGNRNILFNIEEICATCHSKFGNGILKKGEPEEHRVWICVGNENEGRKVLPFESMIPADAYIWSHYRDDPELLKRFVEITESGFSKELDSYGISGNG